jgi:hypothetical protein
LENPEEDEADVSARISIEDNLASTARTTPEISASASLTAEKGV